MLAYGMVTYVNVKKKKKAKFQTRDTYTNERLKEIRNLIASVKFVTHIHTHTRMEVFATMRCDVSTKKRA